jgi:hypothetical protein
MLIGRHSQQEMTGCVLAGFPARPVRRIEKILDFQIVTDVAFVTAIANYEKTALRKLLSISGLIDRAPDIGGVTRASKRETSVLR